MRTFLNKLALVAVLAASAVSGVAFAKPAQSAGPGKFATVCERDVTWNTMHSYVYESVEIRSHEEKTFGQYIWIWRKSRDEGVCKQTPRKLTDISQYTVADTQGKFIVGCQNGDEVILRHNGSIEPTGGKPCVSI